jgi:hypothetical protein
MSQCHDDYEGWIDEDAGAGESPPRDPSAEAAHDRGVEGDQCHDIYDAPASAPAA